MNINILKSLIFVALLFCCDHIFPQVELSLKENALMKKSAIKSVTEWKNESSKQGNITYKLNYTLFDSAGNVVENTSYFSNGNVDGRKTYKYEFQKVTHEIRYASSGAIELSMDYIYDKGDSSLKMKNLYDTYGAKKSYFTYKYNDGKLIEETEYNANGMIAFNTIFKYNKNGLLIEEKKIASDGNTVNKRTFEYDWKDRKTRESIYTYTVVSSKNSFKYDNLGHKTEETFFYSNSRLEDGMDQNTEEGGGELLEIANRDEKGNSITKNSYKYNDKGSVIEKITYDLHDKPKHRWTYKYDEKGNIIEESVYNEDGSIFSKFTSSYNEMGKLTEEAKFTSYYKIGYKWEYTYDDKGLLVNEVKTGSDNVIIFHGKYQYDNRGNRLKEIVYNNNDNDLSTTRIFQFNDKNRVTSEEFFNTDNKLEYKKTFRYDEPGNLVECKEQSDLSFESEVREYTFEYFYKR